jgi:glycerol dehydrogenase-like iron-containing ADH family enzyme
MGDGRGLALTGTPPPTSQAARAVASGVAPAARTAVVSTSYSSYTWRVIRNKERLTVTVDAELIEAGHEAVKAGRADSLSGWVNAALLEREAKERRLRALAEAVAAYEAEFGTISAQEMAAQERADARRAVVVRGPRRGEARPNGKRRRAA